MRHPEGPRFERRLKERQERRENERRNITMSPQEVEAWLKQNHIYGGDRRKGDRRR